MTKPYRYIMYFMKLMIFIAMLTAGPLCEAGSAASVYETVDNEAADETEVLIREEEDTEELIPEEEDTEALIPEEETETFIPENHTWQIMVNQTTCVVTVYMDDEPVRAMLCSVGLDDTTPDGTYPLGIKQQWHELYGPDDTIVYGQYISRITGHILFHSVYYTRYMDNHSLATEEFCKLGEPASHGCVRLSCGDAYYIYANCPEGSTVTIFHGTPEDDSLGKPENQYADWAEDYDPTDPDTED